MVRNTLVDLYTAPIPEGNPGSVFSALRQAQIESTVNPGLKRQRYFVWKLLEYAIAHSFGFSACDIAFHRDEQGKWQCKDCFFSLSHSKDAVAVAVSTIPVGTDIECAERVISPQLAEKVLTAAEKQVFSCLPAEQQSDFLLAKWCSKESLFKAGTSTVFQPDRLEMDTGIAVRTLAIGEKDYCCAVAAEDLSQLRIFHNIRL